MKNLKSKFNIIIFLVYSSFIGAYAQSRTVYEIPQEISSSSKIMRADTVEFDKVLSIARKYGLEKNFQWQPPENNKSMERPKKVVLRISMQEFEEWMKNIAFNEKRMSILNQFYLVDAKKVSTGSEFIALKRLYLNKYPEYLKDEPAFQEKEIARQEKHADQIKLNTENYRQTHKN